MSYLALKQRTQISGNKSPFKYAKQLLKAEGITPFFRSLPITIVLLIYTVDYEPPLLISDGDD